jgi:uncharacterized protein (TIGR03435 family)
VFLGSSLLLRLQLKIGLALLVVQCVACGSYASQRDLKANESSLLPRFAVATIKPNHEGGSTGFFSYPSGRIECRNCSVEMLLMLAYHIWPYQIKKYPGWAESDHYDIVAETQSASRLGGPTPASSLLSTTPTAIECQMLEALLIDRFALRYHRENAVGRVYALRRAKNPLRLDSAHMPERPPWIGNPGGGMLSGSGLAGTSASMNDLAFALSRYLLSPVVNETNLSGLFDFSITLSNNKIPDDITESIVECLRELGLTLHNDHGAVDLVVIDQVERPTPN